MEQLFKEKNIFVAGALVTIVVLGAVMIFVVFSNKGSDTKRGIEFQDRDSCQGESLHSPQCWQDLIEERFQQGGLSAAYDVFSGLYSAEPDFAEFCHEFSHTLGGIAYHAYAQGQEFELNARASYCSFGFYHGLMEALVGTEGDASKARDFCAYVDRELSAERPGSKFACYHGVGHGWASYHEVNPEEWNIVNSSLPFCEEFAETSPQKPSLKLLLCATGVFDTIAIFYYNPQYGLLMNKEDPVWLCKEQTEDIYKEACYREMVTALLWFADYDVARAVSMVEEFVEDEYIPLSVRDLVDGSVRYVINTPRIFDTIALCQSLSERLRLVCVEGFISGVMQFGAPEVEYVQALEFCKDPVFSEDEREICFKKVVAYSSALYSKEKVQDICRAVQEGYRYPEICRSLP